MTTLFCSILWLINLKTYLQRGDDIVVREESKITTRLQTRAKSEYKLVWDKTFRVGHIIGYLF